MHVRPVALTIIVVYKLMKNMINSHLVWHLETNGLLSPHQFGFCKNRSILDPVEGVEPNSARVCQEVSHQNPHMQIFI